MSPVTSPVIILTGGSRGLGLAVLRILLERYNARVTTLSRNITPELEAVIRENSGRVSAIQGDVGDIATNERIMKETVDNWGGVDGLILNAGSVEPLVWRATAKITDLPLNKAQAYVQTNLLSILYLVQPALRHLRKSKGKIVLVSSGASTTGYQAWGLYSLVKAGMNSLCRTIAAEEKENEIGIWAIRPGMVDTSMQALIRRKGPTSMHPSDMEKFVTAFEGGKLLPPEQPGAVIAGLAVGGPIDLSGEYLNWEDDRLASFRR